MPAQGDDVVAMGIELRQPDGGYHFEIAQQPPERLSRQGAAHIVHARLKHGLPPAEALQAASGLGGLFEDGHFVAVLRQDDA